MSILKKLAVGAVAVAAIYKVATLKAPTKVSKPALAATPAPGKAKAKPKKRVRRKAAKPAKHDAV